MQVLNYTSVKLRLAVSVGSNALRALISFATGLFIARALNPAGYGNLMFLLGSFVAIRLLFDMGSSSAFFTFLSQRARGGRFYLVYFSWLAFQFVATLILLWLIIPSTLLEKIWIGNSREIVILAFVATFMQQQIWQLVGQVGESMRKTIKVQFMNLSVALLYLLVILLLSTYGKLTVQNVLFVLVIQYVIATVLAYLYLRKDHLILVTDEKSLSRILLDYWNYCSPLLIMALVGFSYDFADKWMLQKFGGAIQQGFFQIASQCAAVSLLATASILSVFWKEVAAAWNKQDRARVAMLYRKVSRGLVMLGAIMSGLLMPWSEKIVNILLSADYINSWPIFAIMLLYPIHQSMGQICGSMFLATGQTRQYMIISLFVMAVSIPVTYVVLAPAANGWMPGFGLGALGLACKMVVINIVSVNFQSWILARYMKWKYDWVYQLVGIPLMMVLGYVAQMFTKVFWNIGNVNLSELILPVIITSVLYAIMVVITIGQLPWLVGSDRGEIQLLFGRIKAVFNF